MYALGVLAAVGASVLYNSAVALQAMEARRVPREHALRPALVRRLVGNRRWLGATALGLAGWPLEIVALLLAPLTVVQPCLASGLIVLLWLGVRKLGERPTTREYVAVGAIVAGIAGVAWAGPDRTTEHAGPAAIALAALLVGIPIAAPYVLRARAIAVSLLAVVSAGFGYAWTAIASKLLSDDLSKGVVLTAAAWLLTAAVAESLALLSEMSALQHRPATHVAPMMFAIQVITPVAMAPLIFMERWSTTPLDGVALAAFLLLSLAGVGLLAGSRPVSLVIESAHLRR